MLLDVPVQKKHSHFQVRVLLYFVALGIEHRWIKFRVIPPPPRIEQIITRLLQSHQLIDYDELKPLINVRVKIRLR